MASAELTRRLPFTLFTKRVVEPWGPVRTEPLARCAPGVMTQQRSAGRMRDNSRERETPCRPLASFCETSLPVQTGCTLAFGPRVRPTACLRPRPVIRKRLFAGGGGWGGGGLRTEINRSSI